MIVPVPASYTLNGPYNFYVLINTSSSGLAVGQYNVQAFISTSINLPECSLDTPTFTPTFTPTVPHVCNTGSAMYGATAVACINILNATPTILQLTR